MIMFHISVNTFRPQRENAERERIDSVTVANCLSDRERRGEHEPGLADDTIAEGNPLPASLTFSSAPHCLTMPVP